MDLIPLKSSSGGGDGPRTLTLSAAAQSIAEIQTSLVARRSVKKSLRMVGKLEADETRVREISAWVAGRIDRLYIDYTGVSVEAGEKLFDLYSPELFSAQEELLQTIRSTDELSKSSLESTRRSATRTVHAARERLRLWGLTSAQVEAIEQSAAPSDHITIVAPMSGVVLHKDAVEGSYVRTGAHVYSIADLSVLWLKLDVYESDLAWVKLHQTVEFEADSYPGVTFSGTVAFIDPMLNERSRSIKVRVNVDNPDGLLKPGMFARAVVHASIEGEGDDLPLVIPASAPLVTGTRAVVYVADPAEAGQFHGREITLGPKAGDFFVVREGLEEGERVVSNGSFKIDSALQILAKKSMMNPGGGGPAPGHHHGPDAPAPAAETTQVQEIAGIPEEFRAQLDDVLALYFEVTTALSRDNLDEAKAAAAKLPEAALAVEHSLLPAAGHSPWGAAQKGLKSASDAIVAAADIERARQAFHDLSMRMIATVRAFGASNRTHVLVYHCPMAMDGEGADWLQSTVGTENPYYGSMMFKCGSQTETLMAGPDADSGADHTNH
jgi:Cu(I)/Ag(I) efflux system membrane fusion protein